MPSSPSGMACQSLDRASAQHGWTYLNVCTIGPQKHHYLVVVTAKTSQNMKQIISIPTVLILQTDLLGEKKKKRKRKICLTSPPSSSTSLSREAAQTCSILLHRVRCKTGTAQKQHKMGRKPRQTWARNYISRCNALTDLISTSIFLEVWQQTHRWSGTSLNLFNFSLWILLSTMSSLLGSHSRVWDVRGKIFMWCTEFNRSTQGHMASLCCLYSHHPQLCHWDQKQREKCGISCNIQETSHMGCSQVHPGVVLT